MNYFKTGILLMILTLILVGIGSFLGGGRGAMIAFIIALVINGVSYWFSDKIIISMFKAQEIREGEFPHLFQTVREIADEAKIPVPKIYIVPQASPNAFATGRDPQHAALCVTKGILELLDQEELKGVLAHEMAHVKNRDTLIMTVTAAIAGAIMMLAYMARWAAILGVGGRGSRRGAGNLFGILAMSIIAPVAAVIIQLAISRSREYAADRRGAIFARNPSGLARALKRLEQASKNYRLQAPPQTAHLFIVNPFRGNFIATLFSTHPPIVERIRRLEEIKI